MIEARQQEPGTSRASHHCNGQKGKTQSSICLAQVRTTGHSAYVMPQPNPSKTLAVKITPPTPQLQRIELRVAMATHSILTLPITSAR